ncbi:MAG: type II toxin-antitoxin system Phd/YefM family antitoxin [Nitrospirota bacterium]|nr:type II toxin-antitoxin system Phd/YefM family antitoxin [Nitrospirota bacterium]
MKTLPLSEVKMKLSQLVETVSATDEEVMITKNGYPAAVLVSADEFEGWKETVAVQSDRTLTEEIRAGLGELKAKKARLYTLDELFAKQK